MRACLLLLGLVAVNTANANPGWTSLAPGLEIGTFSAGIPTDVADGNVTVLRVDPALWDLQLAALNPTDPSPGRTARQWCKEQGFVAAINSGMFATDHKTHVGYARYRGHVYSDHINAYQSVAAFDPAARKGIPRYRIFDLDEPGVSMEAILKDYSSVVQNLRMIKRPGLNRWPPQIKRWSEAALGEDVQGRILFIFSRSPFTMYDLNNALLSMGIGLAAAQHLEGGLEAQMYLNSGDVEREMFGSYESPFREGDGGPSPRPIPSVLGIRRRSAEK